MSTETPWNQVAPWLRVRVVPMEKKTSRITAHQRESSFVLTNLEQQAQREWNSSPELQAEFKRFSTYLAYRQCDPKQK